MEPSRACGTFRLCNRSLFFDVVVEWLMEDCWNVSDIWAGILSCATAFWSGWPITSTGSRWKLPASAASPHAGCSAAGSQSCAINAPAAAVIYWSYRVAIYGDYSELFFTFQTAIWSVIYLKSVLARTILHARPNAPAKEPSSTVLAKGWPRSRRNCLCTPLNCNFR